jgi:phosphoglycerol transferase MdoB-like AlkP superfamily enzyme
MQETANIGNKKRGLQDFTRLAFAFFFCLVLLAFYQNSRLYAAGVLDGIINKSLFLLVVHHLGFASISALLMAFLFTFLEGLKPALGFKTTASVFVLILASEGILTGYFVDHYEILGVGFYERLLGGGALDVLLFSFALMSLLSSGFMFLFYRLTARYYSLVSAMYPFTIVLFSLFLATLISQKKPVNENKTQHLVHHLGKAMMDFNKYEGAEEYPLLKQFQPQSDLASYFKLKDKEPNLVFIVLDGVGADFVGEKAAFRAFMPYLNSLLNESLYWPNYVSNTGETMASIPSIFGSLPFGKYGFTHVEKATKRETLFSILKANGYLSSFNYGGNSALEQLDKFLDDEKLDLVIDRKGFGPRYKEQEEDAAGISLGFPDGALFDKWITDFESTYQPRLDVFLTQSTKSPFLIPEKEQYMERVTQTLAQERLPNRNIRLINKNREIFASLLYTDGVIKTFMEQYRRKAEFQNTIFIITGSHNLTDLPQPDYLGRYRVPLIIYSPLVKAPERISSLVAHTDILPSLAGLLSDAYGTATPERVAWLGEGLVHPGVFKTGKTIPLFRHKENIQEFIKGQYCLSGATVYGISPGLTLSRLDDQSEEEAVKKEFRYFKAVNAYVTTHDKLVPRNPQQEDTLGLEQRKSDMVWINSMFNGNDYDNAYRTARELAIEGNRERSLLLCRYILEKVPGHADTEILMGRIYAWEKDYERATTILEGAVKKYPVYADAYAALLDVYFWSDTNYKVAPLKEQIRKERIQNEQLSTKIKRAEDKMKKDKTMFDSGSLGFLNFEDDGY